MSPIEKYVAPRTLEEATEILRQGNVTILASGTDLMPQSHAGRVRFQSVLMNIRRVPELTFLADESMERGARILALIEETQEGPGS